MPSKEKIERINKFIDSQQSLQFYEKTKSALYDVLINIPDEDYEVVIKNLIFLVLHEWVLGQMMHFPEITQGCKVIQLTIPQDIPIEVLKFVIAHELWHVMQWKNRNEDISEGFEKFADDYAEKWWFIKTENIYKYICDYWKEPEWF